MVATFGFAFLAGIASILSPCVLPLVPLVLGAATTQHRLGPAMLAAGVAVSFTAVGLFVATLGYALDVDADVFRFAAALIMLLLGAVLLLPVLQVRFATATGPIGNWADAHFGDVARTGASGQFGVGLLLGIVWSPCVGPTLGAASLLASQGQDLGRVAVTMLIYGVGASLPLLVLGILSRQAITRLRGALLDTGKATRFAMGLCLVVVGLVILSGTDRILETKLVDASPAWLTALSTRF